MKVVYCSDLHLEFGPIHLENIENADVLILAGDILLANDNKLKEDNRKFFESLYRQFKYVLAIAGNHEFYNGYWNKGLRQLKNYYGENGIKFLENDVVVINGIRFFGATFWTDCNKNDSSLMLGMQYGMNDYRKITCDSENNIYRKLIPSDTLKRHIYSKNILSEELKRNNTSNFVVITHHAPSPLSTPEKYKEDGLVSAYSSDLNEFILDNNNIKYWIHGHIHDDNDYTIGETRVLSNPRGYFGYEQRALNFDLKYFEV